MTSVPNTNKNNNNNNAENDTNSAHDGPAHLTCSVAEMFSSEENATYQTIQRESRNFSDYERLFQEVLMTIENDDILETFQTEYVNLHNAFLKSHEGESRLLRKCNDLENDIHTCLQKAEAAHSLNESDKKTIEQLKSEWDKTIHKHGATKEKIAMLVDKIDALKDEVHELEEQLHAPIELTEREAALQTMTRMYESVKKEKENQEFALDSLQRNIAAGQKRVNKLKEAQLTNNAQLTQLNMAIARKQEETRAINLLKEEAEMKVKKTRESLTKMNHLAQERQAAIDLALKDGEGHSLHITELKKEMSMLQEQYNELTKSIQVANNSLQVCNNDNDNLHKQVQTQMKALQDAQHKVQHVHKQFLSKERVNAALRTRQVKMETTQAQYEETLQQTQLKHKMAEEELRGAMNEVNEASTRLNLLHKELNVLEQKVMNTSEASQRNKVWLHEKHNQLQHEEHALHEVQTIAAGQMEAMHHMEAEMVNKSQEVQENAHVAAKLLAQVSDQEVQLQQTIQRINNLQMEIRKYSTQLDGATSERNAYSKHYLELRHELLSMNKHLRYVMVESNQIKQEIHRTEQAKQSAIQELSHVQIHQSHMEESIRQYKTHIASQEHHVDAMQSEVRQLNEVLLDAHDEVGRQSRKCKEVHQEQNLLSHKLLNKSKMLEELYEQVHTLQHLLLHEEVMFAECNAQVAQLEQEVSWASHQLQRLQNKLTNFPALQIKRNALSRELRQLQQRLRGLLNEASIKVNIHPHHELAWSNPVQHALQCKVNKLQRSIQLRQEVLQSKENEIASLEDAYLHSKSWIAQEPGPEVAAQLAMYKSTLAKKHHQAQRLESTLVFFRQQMNTFKEREAELRRQLSSIAKRYAARRAKEEEQEEFNEKENELQDKYLYRSLSRSNNKKQQQQQQQQQQDNKTDTTVSNNYKTNEEENECSTDVCDSNESTLYKGFVAPPLPDKDADNNINNNIINNDSNTEKEQQQREELEKKK